MTKQNIRKFESIIEPDGSGGILQQIEGACPDSTEQHAI
jgi:hypothetical protein